MTERLIYLSVPGLRPRDVADPAITPTLHAWAAAGASASLTPSFPCVTSTVQASTWTGLHPGEHGIIANGFYHRDRNEVAFWVERNGFIEGEQIWDCLARAGKSSAAWHAQNIKDAAADFIVTPEPIHHPDGRTELWCYSKPAGLYEKIVAELGHFPLQNYWGPLANIESSRWIIAAARWLITAHDPHFHYIYLPHLDYASQKFGPDSPQAVDALRELDALLADFSAFVMSFPGGGTATILVASEYAMTDVASVVYPNVELRRLGLLKTRDDTDGQLIDFHASSAFAVVDHQCAHIYVRDRDVERVASVFRDLDGVEFVYVGSERDRAGVGHARAGEIVLASRTDAWFAYYWWLDEADAPSFARTVDIHRKPGYDPVALFFDPATRSIPLDASLVKGSHGAPAVHKRQRAALICSRPTPWVESERTYRDTDMKSIVLGLMGVAVG